jgi:lipopolysaccharide/colanic/teichoic acid biosynthesis glycosyltransferase
MPILLQRVAGLLGSIATLPMLVGIVTAVRIDSPGPGFHGARRVGGGGQLFTCYKIRTMYIASEGSGPAVTTSEDGRVTRVGRLLRRYRLDEIPQLWNVARGEMLLVGPRPEDPRFVDLATPLRRQVFTAIPGITGLTQLAFVDEAAMIDSRDPERHYREVILPRKLALDADYLRRRSLRLDMWILGQTILTALGRRTPIEAIEARR